MSNPLTFLTGTPKTIATLALAPPGRRREAKAHGGVRGRPGLVIHHLRAVVGESLIQATSMAKRLYVGNLAYTVSSDDLQELFEQFGAVKAAQVLSDRETGRSRGFGFVEMAEDGEADAAIEGLDGTDHQGRRLTVNEARPRAPGTGGGGRGGYDGGSRGGYGGGY